MRYCYEVPLVHVKPNIAEFWFIRIIIITKYSNSPDRTEFNTWPTVVSAADRPWLTPRVTALIIKTEIKGGGGSESNHTFVWVHENKYLKILSKSGCCYVAQQLLWILKFYLHLDTHTTSTFRWLCIRNPLQQLCLPFASVNVTSSSLLVSFIGDAIHPLITAYKL